MGNLNAEIRQCAGCTKEITRRADVIGPDPFDKWLVLSTKFGLDNHYFCSGTCLRKFAEEKYGKTEN